MQVAPYYKNVQKCEKIMRTIFVLLITMVTTQAWAFDVMSCKVGQKYFGVFMPSWNQMDMPRFIIDEKNKQFRADEGPWVTGNNELSETFAKGLFFENQKKGYGGWLPGFSTREIRQLRLKKQCKQKKGKEDSRCYIKGPYEIRNKIVLNLDRFTGALTADVTSQIKLGKNHNNWVDRDGQGENGKSEKFSIAGFCEKIDRKI